MAGQIDVPRADNRQQRSSTCHPAIDPRRARKRLVDREAQRLSRQRTKDYLKSLENLVEVLSTPAVDGRVERLTDRLKELEAENKRLRDAVLAIRQTVASSTEFVGNSKRGDSDGGHSDEDGAKADMTRQTAPPQPLLSPQPSPPPWKPWIVPNEDAHSQRSVNPMQMEIPVFRTPDLLPAPISECPVLVLPPTPAQFSSSCDDSSAYSLLQYILPGAMI